MREFLLMNNFGSLVLSREQVRIAETVSLSEQRRIT